MIVDVLVALSLPIWLFVEELMRLRMKRRGAAMATSRNRTRHAAITTMLSRT